MATFIPILFTLFTFINIRQIIIATSETQISSVTKDGVPCTMCYSCENPCKPLPPPPLPPPPLPECPPPPPPPSPPPPPALPECPPPPALPECPPPPALPECPPPPAPITECSPNCQPNDTLPQYQIPPPPDKVRPFPPRQPRGDNSFYAPPGYGIYSYNPNSYFPNTPIYDSAAFGIKWRCVDVVLSFVYSLVCVCFF